MLHVIVTPLEEPGEQGQVHKQPCWVSGANAQASSGTEEDPGQELTPLWCVHKTARIPVSDYFSWVFVRKKKNHSPNCHFIEHDLLVLAPTSQNGSFQLSK